jgi:hypothetical protein
VNTGAPDCDLTLDRLTGIEYEVVGRDRAIDPNQPAPAGQARPSTENDEIAVDRETVTIDCLIA